MDPDVCRICFKYDNTLVSINCKRNGISASENITSKLKIKLHEDGPSLICSHCLTELDGALRFLEKCENSNQIVASQYKCRYDSKWDPLAACNGADYPPHAEIEEVSSTAAMGDEKTGSEVRKENKPVEEQRRQESRSQYCCEQQVLPVPGSAKPVHTCPHCCKEFIRKCNLTAHLKRHSAGAQAGGGGGGGPAARARRCCPAPGCGKSFTTATNLNTHIRSHTGERPHSCALCGRRFASRNTLTNHMRTHTGVKPYLCSECGARFATNKLSEHARAHAGLRAHACVHAPCPRTFRSVRAARLHARTHTAPLGARALPCPHDACAARYAHAQSLNKHIRRHHPQAQKATSTAADSGQSGPTSDTNCTQGATVG